MKTGDGTAYVTAHRGCPLAFNNTSTGEVSVRQGRLHLLSCGQGYGVFDVRAGAELGFSSNETLPQELTDQSEVGGLGDVVFYGGTTTVLGKYEVTGTTWVLGGAVNFNGTTPAEITTGFLGWGALGGTGVVKILDKLSWGDGIHSSYMTGTGETVIESGARLELVTTVWKHLTQHTLTVRGSALMKDNGRLYFSEGASVENFGTFEAVGNEPIEVESQLDDSELTFTNHPMAKFIKSGPGETYFGQASHSSVKFLNFGTVEVNDGDLTFWGPSGLGGLVTVREGGTLHLRSSRPDGPTVNDDGVITGTGRVVFHGTNVSVLGSVEMTGPGTVFFQSGTTVVKGVVAAQTGLTVLGPAWVTGTGTLRGPVRNEGNTAPGESWGQLAGLTIDGDYVQANTGRLHLDLGPASSDLLAVKGRATLAGTLTVYWHDQQSSPPIGSVYTMLSYDTYEEVGSFAVAAEPSRIVVEKGFDVVNKVLTVSVTRGRGSTPNRPTTNSWLFPPTTCPPSHAVRPATQEGHHPVFLLGGVSGTGRGS